MSTNANVCLVFADLETVRNYDSHLASIITEASGSRAPGKGIVVETPTIVNRLEKSKIGGKTERRQFGRI